MQTPVHTIVTVSMNFDVAVIFDQIKIKPNTKRYHIPSCYLSTNNRITGILLTSWTTLQITLVRAATSVQVVYGLLAIVLTKYYS